MTTLKCVIVEDSPLHRILLEKIINQNNHIQILHSFDNGINALEFMNRTAFDLLFLDIELPKMNGFELLNKLNQSPQTIITSANPTHATKAFDFNVTDYLLKPYTVARFNKAIEKVLVKSKLPINTKIDEDFILVKSNLKEIRLFSKDILWIEALGDYVKIITKERKLIVLSTMKAFIEKLPQEKFLRIHKSYIVNIEKIELYNHRHVQVDSNKLPMSRNSNIRLDEILNLLN